MTRFNSILDGNVFMVSDGRGDIEATPTDTAGLFAFDTRYLSRWVLTVDGQRLSALSVDDLHYFETRFFLVPGTGTIYVDAKLSVVRDRSVAGGFREVVTILNHDDKTVRLVVRVDAEADFADLFEIKDVVPKRGKIYTRLGNGGLILGYQRESYRRELSIRSSHQATFDETGMTFEISIPPHGRWSTSLSVGLTALATDGTTVLEIKDGRSQEEMRDNLQQWIDAAPQIDCDWQPLKTAYRRSLIDLAGLRFSPLTSQGRSLPAAGLPWFMTMFGRDSIFTSLQTLPISPSLAETTLRELGERQGTRIDDFRDEDPGRIMHEMRYGELTAFEERPHSPYFGTADATPLFVVLLDEYERWSGDVELVKELEPEARAAIAWIDDYADLMENGYLWYQRRNEQSGLENQCWKDSWDAIAYSDGRLPGFPRATCELQGYAYDAKMRAARLARLFWRDPDYADTLEKQAAQLKLRFNRDFWITERGYYALALDDQGEHVDALSSNIGHLLWSGIVDASKARAVARHLMSPQMFSGWGVRTMSTDDRRYNPIGYHVGTVWPFDNSIIAWGLRRYGFKEEAERIAAGILDAADYFDGRLPEAFAGYERSETRYPVEYPTACSPQAWSTGTPFMLLRTMLGLEPHGDHLIVDPAVPNGIGHLELLNIPGRWGRVDAFARSTMDTERQQLRPQLSSERDRKGEPAKGEPAT